ncbi:dynactin p62 family-domain-containing protein [Dipodascopsis tothii]|uniref:dynactin p62 family-domain-containing protein n=1 Tax=Dipodascopsis tothii TaxID=44089 RepID=UPI0034CFC552
MALPDVRVHCPCAEPPDGERAEADGLELPRTLMDAGALHALNSLYFCEDCRAIRCPRCVYDEIVQVYCPSCLHVYMSEFDEAHSQRQQQLAAVGWRRPDRDYQTCTRNCFQCPVCAANLLILAGDGAHAGEVYVQCAHCLWDSRSVPGLVFTKQTSLFSQFREKYAHAGAAARVDALGQFYRAAAAAEAEAAAARAAEGVRSAPSSPQSKYLPRRRDTSRLLPGRREPTPVSPRTAHLYGQVPAAKALQLAAQDLAALVVPLDEEADLAAAKAEAPLTRAQLDAQHYAAPTTTADLLPVPQRLRSRLARRCRACRHILVRPDTARSRKAAAPSLGTVTAALKICLLSRNYLPTVHVTSLNAITNPQAFASAEPPAPAPTMFSSARPLADAQPSTRLRPQRTYHYVLTLVNPLYERMRVSLATATTTPAAGTNAGGHKVTLLAPAFDIGGYETDAIEDWDVGMIGVMKAKLAALQVHPSLAAGATAGGVFDRGRNWTSVVMEVVPAPGAGNAVEIPIFVSVEHDRPAELPELAAEGDIQTPERAAKTATRREQPRATADDDVDGRRAAFWTVLRLGAVVE